MARGSTKREAIAAAADREPKHASSRATTTDADIARRAYDLYLARGGESGHDVEDWLQAERELNGSARAV
jgi:hypothetical protein